MGKISSFGRIGIIIAPAFFFMVSTNVSQAETLVDYGLIAEDTTWTKDGSPYIVRSDVWVDDKATLSIEPGVVVKFDDVSLNVGGRLVLGGTSDEKIYLTSIHDDGVGGDTNNDQDDVLPGPENGWGIGLFNLSRRSEFEHVVISHVYRGIFVGESSLDISNTEIKNIDRGLMVFDGDLDIQNTTIEEIHGNLFSVHNDGRLEISHTKISEVLGGDVVNIYGAQVLIEDTLIRDIFSGDAVSVYGGGSVHVVDSLLSDGVGYGVVAFEYGSEIELERNVISGFSGVAIASYGGVLTGSFNEIHDNLYGLEVYDGQINFAQNSIHDNLAGLMTAMDYDFDFTNNWWGDSSGPYHEDVNPGGLGDEIIGNTNFDPWLISDPLVETVGFSNVLFLPGIKASRLYVDGFIGDNTLWEPNRNSDVEQLYLDEDGVSIRSDIYTGEVIDEVYGHFSNIYKSFIDTMDSLVEEGVMHEWAPFPYDWRLDLKQIVLGDTYLSDGATINLIEEVERLAQTSDSGQVTIVAHSNGGLVAKVLISELERQDKSNLIDQMIMVGTPQLGTPAAIGSLLHADGEEQVAGLITSQETARQLAENMPSGYNLLPSPKLTEIIDEDLVVFADGEATAEYRDAYGSGLAEADELRDFYLAGSDGRDKPAVDDVRTPNVLNEGLLAQAQDTQDFLDSWQAPDGVEVVQIAGWGLDTIKGIKYQDKVEKDCSFGIFNCQEVRVLDHRPMFTVDGDGTVVTPSAVVDGGVYYLNLDDHNSILETNRNHGDILEVGSIMELLSHLIRGSEVDDAIEFITKVQPISSSLEDRLQISVHSPVSIVVENDAGDTTGEVLRTDPLVVSEDIPNSYYTRVGEGKYVGLSSVDDYQVKLTGEDHGSFDLEIRKPYQEDELVAIFENVAVLADSSAELTISESGEVGTLEVDLDSDGEVDVSYQAGADASRDNLEAVHHFVDQMQADRMIKRILLIRVRLLDMFAGHRNPKIYTRYLDNLTRFIGQQTGKRISEEDATILIKFLN